MLLSAVSACRTLPPRPILINETQPWLTQGKKPKVALVLSGGASRGFAHIGVLRVLEQEKIPIDFVIGTSVGSLIGALYGASKNSFELEWLAHDLNKEDIFDFTFMTPTQGFVKGDRLMTFLQDKVGEKKLEDLRIPLYVTATDLETGELVIFFTGSVVNAVRASAGIPALFPPITLDGRVLVDGGVANNIPADTAREMGADIVIVVDISKTVVNRSLSNIKDYAMQSSAIMMAINSQSKLHFADIVIKPEVGAVGIWDFSRKKELISAGIDSAEKSLPQIKAAFQKWFDNQTASRK